MSATVQGGGNDFQQTKQVVITLTASGLADPISTVHLFRGTGEGSATALPTGITMSGDYSNIDQFNNAVRDTAINIREIVLESTTTDHFGGTYKIERYKRYFNNEISGKELIYLNKYKTDSGGGVSTTLTISDRPIFVTPRTVMTFMVKQSANMTITLIYDYEEDRKAVITTNE